MADSVGSRTAAVIGLRLIAALGVAVAIFGLYFAVAELMETPVCFPSGVCLETRQPGNVVTGVVICVAGCLLAWRAIAARRANG